MRTFSLPDQTTHSGEVLHTDGTNVYWAAGVPGSGVTIGEPVVGGTPFEVLYTDDNGDIYSDSLFLRSNLDNSTIIARTDGGVTNEFSLGNTIAGGVSALLVGTDGSDNAYAGVQGVDHAFLRVDVLAGTTQTVDVTDTYAQLKFDDFVAESTVTLLNDRTLNLQNTGLRLPIENVFDTNVTLDLTQHTVVYKNLTASKTVNLPALSSAYNSTYDTGIVYVIKDGTGGDLPGFTITIEPNGAETIDGQPNYVMNVSGQAITIQAGANDWSII